MKLYGIKTCDSVKKAIKFLKENQIDFDFIDFKTMPISCEKIEEWLQQVDIDTLFNKRGKKYKELKLKDLNLDDTAKKEWLCKENILIKRPVIEYKNKIIVGFNIDKYKEFL